jgi:uncharacterized DUF497 family protein
MFGPGGLAKTTEIQYMPAVETPREIEWDEANAEAHLAKHGVPFDFAARVFLDPGRADFDATHAEDGEVRRKAVGMIEGKLYTVVYAPKADAAWIISARRANAQETRRYA